MKKLLLPILFLASVASAEDTPFTAISTSFKNGESLTLMQVASNGDCKGKNLSPQIAWTGTPKEANSLAITMYDPDAPTGSGWWHWTVFNIPSSTTVIEEGVTPPLEASQGRTDAGISRYTGICPPKGDEPHHYHLTVWALKEATTPLNALSSGAMVGGYLRKNAIASTTITGLYSR